MRDVPNEPPAASELTRWLVNCRGAPNERTKKKLAGTLAMANKIAEAWGKSRAGRWAQIVDISNGKLVRVVGDLPLL